MSKFTAAMMWMAMGSVGTLVASSLFTRSATLAQAVPGPAIETRTAAPAQPIARGNCPCPGDFNGDNLINTIDLSAFLAVFGTACCDDGDLCTEDTLVEGVCVHTPVNCDDGNPKTTDTCDPKTGQCIHVYCIDDGDPCTIDLYNPNTHECYQVPLDCDDGNPCTLDWCVPGMGCVHASLPNGSRCDDGNPCTINDVCVNGVCIGTPIVCDDGIPCTIDVCINGRCASFPVPDGTACPSPSSCYVDGVCVNGACTPGTPVVCPPDGNPCTTEICMPGVGCVHVPNALPCDDGNPCTINDVCVNGVCKGTLVQCPPGESCHPATGLCGPNPG